MERSQHQKRSEDSGPPMSNETDQQSSLNSSVDKVAQFVQASPLMFLGGLWVSILLIGTIGLSGLLSPGLSSGRRASEASFGSSTVATNVEPTKERSRQRIPIWLFGAIALSCTAGSIFVSKKLTRTDRPRRISRPKHPANYAATSRPKRPRKPPQAGRAQPRSTHPRPLKPFSPSDYPTPLSSQTVLQAYSPVSKPISTKNSGVQAYQPRPATASSAKKPVAPVPVTIVPPEENHPLDWGEASLADTMDIRKQRSLSSWM
jgi:hypothetical protein